MPARDIGVDVAAPKQECTDPHCPFHGGFSVRGQIIDGQVMSTQMQRSARVQREYLRSYTQMENLHGSANHLEITKRVDR